MGLELELSIQMFAANVHNVIAWLLHQININPNVYIFKLRICLAIDCERTNNN